MGKCLRHVACGFIAALLMVAAPGYSTLAGADDTAARPDIRTEVVRRYDEPFARAWELYLAASSATFRSSGLQLFQVVFAPAGNNTLPNDRRDLYCQPAAPKDA